LIISQFKNMLVQVMKSKIHRVTVTEADVDYIGSVTIDPILIKAANLFPGEKVQVLNLDTGERLETYVITGDERGQIGINGPAALKIKVGHKVIIVAYGFININEVKNHRPFVVFPNEKTNLLK